MKRVRFALASITAAALLAACGGGGDGNQAPAVAYSKMVVFGDSLSDVGTYATPGMIAITTAAGSTHAGKYTVNASDGSGLNWTEVLADQLRVDRPCPAMTGLNSTSDATLIAVVGAGAAAGIASLAHATDTHSGCYSYAQGGSRVTNPVGPFNAYLTGSSDPATHVQGNLGQLTVPVVTQIANHLAAVSNQFGADDLVVVAAGANDMFMNLGTLAGASDANAALTAAVLAMKTAADQLVAAITTSVVGKGAKRVLVLNIPDASTSPYIVGLEATNPGTQIAVSQMVTAFNARLAAGLASVPGILLVDAYTASQKQHDNPAAYGLTNVTASACNTTPSATNLAFSSLMCNEFNLNSGVTKDNYNTYLFADGNHPTPYGYKLLAQLVAGKMVARGWL